MVDGDQVLHRIHLIEDVNFLPMEEVVAQFFLAEALVANTCLPVLGVATNS